MSESNKEEKDWKNANPLGNFIMRIIVGGGFGIFILFLAKANYGDAADELLEKLPMDGIECVIISAIITAIFPNITNSIANSKAVKNSTEQAFRIRK